MSDDKQGAAKLADLAEDIKIAMFTTTDDEGHYVSRPMLTSRSRTTATCGSSQSAPPAS